MAALAGLPGLEAVLDKATACALHDLPADREADVVVISTADTCIGARQADHDLSGLAGHRLRTHGGVSEAKVPLILSVPLNDTYKLKAATATPKSWQVFDYALNGTLV
jgi:phosphonoacetate hydrolase